MCPSSNAPSPDLPDRCGNRGTMWVRSGDSRGSMYVVTGWVISVYVARDRRFCVQQTRAP